MELGALNKIVQPKLMLELAIEYLRHYNWEVFNTEARMRKDEAHCRCVSSIGMVPVMKLSIQSATIRRKNILSNKSPPQLGLLQSHD